MRKLKLRPGALPPGVTLADPAAVVATGGGVGLAPFAPGTCGSLAALPVGWLIEARLGIAGLIVAALLATLAGTWAADRLERAGGAHDTGARHRSLTRYPMARRRSSTTCSSAETTARQAGPGNGTTIGCATRSTTARSSGARFP